MVCLTGFMGSGKSTIGRLLAAQLAWRFADLDTEIERESGLTVSQIFARQGEAVFRDIEHECLKRVLGSASERNTRLILALGGRAHSRTGRTAAWRRRLAGLPGGGTSAKVCTHGGPASLPRRSKFS